jgi:hypothetical protein
MRCIARHAASSGAPSSSGRTTETFIGCQRAWAPTLQGRGQQPSATALLPVSAGNRRPSRPRPRAHRCSRRPGDTCPHPPTPSLRNANESPCGTRGSQAPVSPSFPGHVVADRQFHRPLLADRLTAPAAVAHGRWTDLPSQVLRPRSALPTCDGRHRRWCIRALERPRAAGSCLRPPLWRVILCARPRTCK